MASTKFMKVVRHAEIFADFWLGVAAAGLHGAAEMVAAEPTAKDEATVFQRTASGLKVALKAATEAAQKAHAELGSIETHHQSATPELEPEAVGGGGKSRNGGRHVDRTG